MKRTKEQKAITLIALIITIVVLLILAAVAISSITNDGILGYATNAAKDYNQAVVNEQERLNEYLNFLNDCSTTGGEGSGNGNGSGNGSGGTTQTVATVKNTVLSTTSNTEVYDEYGNKIVVPAGFKIRVDSSTNNADTVTEGIVIEDGTNGNQFVWIPVGKIYTDTAKTEANAKTITLGRYVFDSNGNIDTSLSKTNPSDELKPYFTSIDNFTEGLKNSTTTNAHARDIDVFISSANTKGGYYLGRYEARKNSNGDLTTISTDTVWNGVNQATASSESQGMYADGYESGTFSSDLISSYAWDTAIVFLQTFDNRVDKTTPYSMQTSLNESLSETGTTTDAICNIYDMASNCFEWSTETYSATYGPCVYRGGYYTGAGHASGRYNYSTSVANDYGSFRPLLYIGL